MFCYCQDHVQQQISALHVVKDYNIQQPTTDLDIDKAAKAFGEWGNGNDSTHKRRGTCTEAVGLIRFLFITLLSVSSRRNEAISINSQRVIHYSNEMQKHQENPAAARHTTQLMFLGMGWHWSLLQFHPKRPTIETATCVAPTQWQTKTLAGWAVIVFWFYLFLFFVGGRKKRTSKAKKVFLYTSLSSLLHTFTSLHLLTSTCSAQGKVQAVGYSCQCEC